MTLADTVRVAAAALTLLVATGAAAQTQLDRLQKERDTVELLQQQLEAQNLRERIAASQASQARSEAELKRAAAVPVPSVMPTLPPAVLQVPLPLPVGPSAPRPSVSAARPPADRGPQDVALIGTMGVDGRYHATFRVAGIVIADLPAGSVMPDGTKVETVGDGAATIRQGTKTFSLRAAPIAAAPVMPAALSLPPPIMVPTLPTNLVPAQ